MFSGLLSTDFQASQPMVCVSVSPMLMYLIMSLAELHEDIQTAISNIVKDLEDSDSNVQQAALYGLPYFAIHGMCHCSSNADVLNCVFS